MGTSSIIILAAGGSARLGLPKQLLHHKGKSLLRRSAETALAAHPANIIAVLGFESDRMKHELDDLPVHIVVNNEWHEGIASSIREGINALPPTTNSALIMLCDQPFVNSDLLVGLMEACSEQKPIAATGYDQTSGVPACFLRSMFSELVELKGDQGAKTVIRLDASRVNVLPFNNANIDIDTIEDFQKLIDSTRQPSQG